MSVNDRWRVTVDWESPATDIAQSVFHYNQNQGAEDHLDEFAVAIEAMLALAWAEIENSIMDEVGLVAYAIAKYDPATQTFDTVYQDTLSGLVGVNTDDMLPHQDNGVVKFFTDIGQSIGKKFIMGIVETMLTDSVLGAGVVTALALMALELDDTLTGANGGWRPGNFNALTNVFRPWIGTVEANALVGSQDRRRPGFGL